MRAAGSWYSRASWVLLRGLRQPERLCWSPVEKQLLAASLCGGQCWHLCFLPSVRNPCPRLQITGNAAKAVPVGRNCGAAQRVKGVELTVCREQISLMMCVFISQSCWTVLRCTQYILSWNAIFFSLTPQCKPCWKNKNPLCLEVRPKYLFYCLQLLSAFKNWRLNTDPVELKSGWVTKQDWLQIRPRGNLECRRVVHTALKVPHSAKLVNLK